MLLTLLIIKQIILLWNIDKIALASSKVMELTVQGIFIPHCVLKMYIIEQFRTNTKIHHLWVNPIISGLSFLCTTNQMLKINTQNTVKNLWLKLEPTQNQFLKNWKFKNLKTNLRFANQYLCTSIGTTHCPYLSLVHSLIFKTIHSQWHHLKFKC